MFVRQNLRFLYVTYVSKPMLCYTWKDIIVDAYCKGYGM